MANDQGDVGTLFFGMSLDTTEFKKRLKEVREEVKQVGDNILKDFKTIAKGFAIVFAGASAAAGGLLLFTKNTLQATNAQLQLADSIGATQGEIAGLELAANSLQVETSMLIDKMREFGGVDAFKEYADQVKSAGNEQDQLNKAIEIFGGEGAKLLPLLQLGSEGLNQFQQEAKEAGLALSPEQIAASRAAWEEYTEVIKNLQGLGQQLGAAFLKPLGLIASAVNGFIDTFQDDIINGFNAVSDFLVSFIQGAIDAFVKFGIPFINGFISFANQIAETFQALFDWLSPAAESTFTTLFGFFQKLVDFMSTIRQSLIIGISKVIEMTITGFFSALQKLNSFIGDLVTTLAFMLEAAGLEDDGFGQAVSDAFGEQNAALFNMRKEFVKPFADARQAAMDEMVEIFIEQDNKNTAQQNRFKAAVSEFTFKFDDAIATAADIAEKQTAAIEKNAAVSEKFASLVLSGSQEEFNIINQTRNRELEELTAIKKETKETKEAIKNLDRF